MKTVIMQPNYLPWIGYMNLMKQADVFVIYDDVQYTKNDWRNRNKIKTPDGCMWLTVPVHNGGKPMIKNVTVNDNLKWREKHLKALRMNYKGTFYFDEVYGFIEDVLSNRRKEHLYIISMALIVAIKSYLGLQCEIHYSSEIGFTDLKRTDRLVKICEQLKGTEYLSPNRSADYLEPEKFKDAGIELLWHNYRHPKYNQQWGDFITNLSVVDLLFNYGRKGVDLI